MFSKAESISDLDFAALTVPNVSRSRLGPTQQLGQDVI